MAYQPKSYKKFVATAATATLVASAIVPAASAASTASFTDVSAKYKVAVDYLVENNITVGLTETSFGVDSTIKRGDAAIMLAKALGIVEDENAAPSGFTDVPARAALAINSLKAAGIVSGKTATSFGFNDNLTRGEVALIMANVKAYDLSGDTSSLKFTDVSSRYASAVAGFVEAGITSGKTATTFGTGDAIKRGDFAIFVYRAEQLNVVAEAKVESVTAVNAKQVEVKFASAMNASTLVDSTGNLINVTFNETSTNSEDVTDSLATGTLSADGKTLTITLGNDGNEEYFDGTYSITVSEKAKTADGKALINYAGTFAISDEVAPQVAAVSAKTNTNVATTAHVVFSEPIFSGVVKIDGVAYNPTSGMGTDTLTFTGLSLSTGTNHTVEVINATDVVGNVKQLQSLDFQVNKDTVAPKVSFAASGDHKVVLTFDKAMNASTVATSVKIVDESLSPVAFTVSGALAGSNGTKYVVTITEADLYDFASTRTLTLQVNDSALDALGNKAIVTTQNVTLTEDNTAPTFAGSSVVNNAAGDASKLRLTFNESLNGSIDTNKITAKNAVTGESVVASNLLSNPVFLSDGKTVQFDVSNAAVGNKYNFIVGAGFVQDSSFDPNNSAGFATTVSFAKGAASFTVASTSTSANVITVTYSGSVLGDFSTNAANNPSNYTVAGQTLTSGTDITVSSGNVVTIKLPSEFIATTDAEALLTINNVKSLAGVTLKPYVGTISVEDNTTPKLTAVKWNSATNFTLDFSEAVLFNGETGVVLRLNGNRTLDAADFTFYAGNGADAGNIVVGLETATSATYGTYVDVNNDNVYNSATDILVADIVNVSATTTGDATLTDAEGNTAKANVTVVGNK